MYKMPRFIIRARKTVQVPKIVFDDEFWTTVATVARSNVRENILNQKQADGGELKRNATSTMLKKLGQGKALLSLVDEPESKGGHRFVRSGDGSWKLSRFLPDGRGVVVGPATEELRSLMKYLYDKGYWGYFGLSASGVSAIRALIRQRIHAIWKRAGWG